MLQCDSWQSLESHGKAKGGASQPSCRPTKTESCLNTYIHWDGGGALQALIRILKTGEPLIKNCPVHLSCSSESLRWLMSSTLILLFFGSRCQHFFAADNTVVKLWCQEREKNTDPTSSLAATSEVQWVCVVCRTSHVPPSVPSAWKQYH